MQDPKATNISRTVWMWKTWAEDNKTFWKHFDWTDFGEIDCQHLLIIHQCLNTLHFFRITLFWSLGRNIIYWNIILEYIMYIKCIEIAFFLIKSLTEYEMYFSCSSPDGSALCEQTIWSLLCGHKWKKAKVGKTDGFSFKAFFCFHTHAVFS